MTIDTGMLNDLKTYFSNRTDVAFSFLFGSYARGTAHTESDIDIAVYFFPEERYRYPVEYEKEVYYDGEDEIRADLEKLLGKEVELLALNRVSASISASAIRGTRLVIKDWKLYLDFMQMVTREAEDYAYMLSKDFLREYER